MSTTTYGIISEENRESMVRPNITPPTPEQRTRYRNGRIDQLNAALGRTTRVSRDRVRELEAAGVKSFILANADNSYRFIPDGSNILIVHGTLEGRSSTAVYSLSIRAARRQWSELRKSGCSRW